MLKGLLQSIFVDCSLLLSLIYDDWDLNLLWFSTIGSKNQVLRKWWLRVERGGSSFQTRVMLNRLKNLRLDIKKWEKENRFHLSKNILEQEILIEILFVKQRTSPLSVDEEAWKKNWLDNIWSLTRKLEWS